MNLNKLWNSLIYQKTNRIYVSKQNIKDVREKQ